MKKIIIIAFFMLMITEAVMVVRAKREKVTITVWDYLLAQSAYYEEEIKLFQKEYPWIEVRRVKQVHHRYKALVELAARKDETMPDLYYPRTSNIIEDIEMGWAVPLDKWATREWKKRFPKGSFVEGIHTLGGKTYTIPFSKPYVWHQLYLNRKVFRDSGLVDSKGNILRPKTWAEYRKFAKIITEKGKGKVWGVGLASKPYHLFAHYYYEWARWAGAAGGDHVERFEMDYRVGKYTFDHPAYLQVFKLLLDLKKDGSIIPTFLSMDDETLKIMFADGKIGMLGGGIWNQTGWESTHPGWLDYECVPEPAPDRKGYRGMQNVLAEPSCYLMSRACRHPEEAWLFIDWLTTPEAGTRYAKSGNGLSIYPEANTKNVKTKQFGQYVDICNTFLRWAPNPIARNNALGKIKLDAPMPNKEDVFWGIMSGRIKEADIPKALKNMNDAYNAELEKQIKKLQSEGFKVSMKDFVFPDWNPMENYEPGGNKS